MVPSHNEHIVLRSWFLNSIVQQKEFWRNGGDKVNEKWAQGILYARKKGNVSTHQKKKKESSSSMEVDTHLKDIETKLKDFWSNLSK